MLHGGRPVATAALTYKLNGGVMQPTTVCPILSSGVPDPRKCLGPQCEWWTRNDRGDFHCAIRVLNDMLAELTKMIIRKG